jgi:hypothetical protein
MDFSGPYISCGLIETMLPLDRCLLLLLAVAFGADIGVGGGVSHGATTTLPLPSSHLAVAAV